MTHQQKRFDSTRTLGDRIVLCDLKQGDVIYFVCSKYGLNSFTTLVSRYLYEGDKTDNVHLPPYS